MYDDFILEALQSAIASVATLPVKYVGINISPPSDGKWVEVVHIPNNIEGEFWDGSKTYQGFMRLILHWPQDGSGTKNALTALKVFSNKFQKGSVFQDSGNNVSVKISEEPNFMGVIEESPSMLFPLTVRYIWFKPS